MTKPITPVTRYHPDCMSMQTVVKNVTFREFMAKLRHGADRSWLKK